MKQQTNKKLIKFFIFSGIFFLINSIIISALIFMSRPLLFTKDSIFSLVFLQIISVLCIVPALIPASFANTVDFKEKRLKAIFMIT